MSLVLLSFGIWCLITGQFVPESSSQREGHSASLKMEMLVPVALSHGFTFQKRRGLNSCRLYIHIYVQINCTKLKVIHKHGLFYVSAINRHFHGDVNTK
jgi:hypothetical protein